MSKLKRNLFLLVVALLTAKVVYAAVVPIVDTPASSSYGQKYLMTPLSSSSSSGETTPRTSTYSGVTCGTITATTENGCKTTLGIDDAVATPCDGGKYTCSCPSTYNKSCTSSSEMGVGVACGGKYKSCQTIGSITCNEIVAMRTGLPLEQVDVEKDFKFGFETTNSSNCQTSSPFNYTLYRCKLNASDTTEVNFCMYPICQELINNPNHPLRIHDKYHPNDPTPNADMLLQYPEGDPFSRIYCYDTTSQNYSRAYYCNEEYTETPVGECASNERHEICEVEKTRKYGECTDSPSTLCSIEDTSFILKRRLRKEDFYSGGVDDCHFSAEFMDGFKNGTCVLLNENGRILPSGYSQTDHCQCNSGEKDVPPVYPYTQACEGYRIESGSPLVGSAVVPVVSKLNLPISNNKDVLDFCLWDAQSSVPYYDEKEPDEHGTLISVSAAYNANTYTTTFAAEKLRYKSCLPKCPDNFQITLASEVDKSTFTCPNGLPPNSCAVEISATDSAITGYVKMLHEKFSMNIPTFYEEALYCGCPLDWKTSCPAGEALAGSKCSSGGTDYYSHCVKTCDNTSPKQSTPVKESGTETKCSTVEGGEFVQTHIPNTGKCSANGDFSQTVSCGSDNAQCCLSATECYTDFFKVSESASSCIPMNVADTFPSLCIDPSVALQKSPIVSVQCSCPDNYKSCSDASSSGIGARCPFEGSDKYAECSVGCPTDKTEYLVTNIEDCKIGSENGKISECYTDVSDLSTKKYICKCPDSFNPRDGHMWNFNILGHCIRLTMESEYLYSDNNKLADLTRCKNNTKCTQCLKEFVGYGTSCDFDARNASGTIEQSLIKHQSIIISCKFLEENFDNKLHIVDNFNDCAALGLGTPTEDNYRCHDPVQNKRRSICRCPGEFRTKSEFCNSSQARPAGISEADCLRDYNPIGEVCALDTSPRYWTGYQDVLTNVKADVPRFKTFVNSCPDSTIRPAYDSKEKCMVGDDPTADFNKDYEHRAHQCSVESEDGSGERFYCDCPSSFITECKNPNEILGGLSCEYDSLDYNDRKYQKCLPQCEETAETPVVISPEDCPTVDGEAADTSYKCFNKKGDPIERTACRCPKNGWQTLEEYCGNDGVTYKERKYTKEECLKSFIGVGTVCTFDGYGVRKYQRFEITCPTDRPLFYTSDECSQATIPGTVDYTCYEKDNLQQQRVVCKCPSSWVDVEGKKVSAGSQICSTTEEASGTTCNFDSLTSLKYEKCYPKCQSVPTNGQNLTYMDEEEPTILDCTEKLGDGATFGVDSNGSKCSKNHELYTPCYCGPDFINTCQNDNQRPAENSLACTIGGTTYYKTCENNACREPSSSIAIIEMASGNTNADAACKSRFGSGATGRNCGISQAECSCDPRTFVETCDYPLDKPDKSKVEWCRLGEGSTQMENGTDHFKLGECKVRTLLAKCGKHILLDSGRQDSTPIIYVTETESQCKTRFGSGAKAQLCEYEDNTDKRAFNCYFSLSDFPITEDTCPVRHVLSSEYITYNNTKYYKSCDCHSAYKHHKYNCSGMLSGGACTQKLTKEMIDADVTLKEAGISVGTELSQYPYCQCTSDYSQVCDGERYIGVGKPCNGKYTACECKKDELPENWADNYYGCPGGKKPTGVTKPNGCGGKYYQCSVTECTWQHTEKCLSPLIGVDPCQDNQGNIGGYKSCRCPDGYKKCSDGIVGKGEPCILNGDYYYTSCEETTTCNHGESKTCQEEFLVGVNPCTRNNVTYFEYCKCSAGFDKLCDDGEVGVGLACKLNGKEYYQSCSKPSSTCTSEHTETCDTFQEKYDPCVSSDNKLLYKCKCPSNWSTCRDTGSADGADRCTATDGTIYYNQCAVSGQCSPLQEKTYSVCTSSQKGSGGSCVSTESNITKYAVCEETSSCRLNGYKYTCLGFDQEALGTDSCVDENGNRLYKECKCPAKWITCPGKNNKKGRSCTGLSESGASMEPVYESCTCDATLYKYTCQIEEFGSNLNTGVLPAVTKSCTPATYDSSVEGNRKEGETLYQSCACKESFTHTCSGNGHIVENAQPYCQKVPNGSKLYEYCACSDDFITQCKADTSNPGLTAPRSEIKICTPLNPSAAGYEGITGSLYSSCECGQAYRFECEKNNAYGDDKDKCEDPVTHKTYYSACNCDQTLYPEKCDGNGVIPIDAEDKCVKQYNEGTASRSTTYYSGCKCEDKYKYSCTDPSDGQGIYYTPETYALNTISANNICSYKYMGETFKQYTHCPCPSSYTDCAADGKVAAENSKLCMEVSADGTVTEKYSACSCDVSAEAEKLRNWGYVASSASSVTDPIFAQEVEEMCGHKQNFIAKRGICTPLYFKCGINDTSYRYTEASCAAETWGTSANKWTTKPQELTGSQCKNFETEALRGMTVGNSAQDDMTNEKSYYQQSTVGNLCTQCDCADIYKYTESLCDEISRDSSKGGSEFNNKCFIIGTAQPLKYMTNCDDLKYLQQPSNEDITYWNNPFSASTKILTVQGNSCVNRNQETKWEYCDCNADSLRYIRTHMDKDEGDMKYYFCFEPDLNKSTPTDIALYDAVCTLDGHLGKARFPGETCTEGAQNCHHCTYSSAGGGFFYSRAFTKRY